MLLSVVGILDHVWIEDVQGLRNLHSEHLYAITAKKGANDDIELDDADAVWLSKREG